MSTPIDKNTKSLQEILNLAKNLPNKTTVDPTLTIKGMAADAKATGDAVKPIASIIDTTTTNKIEWDGVIGDRLTVTMEGQTARMVHVSDYVPDMDALTDQSIELVYAYIYGDSIQHLTFNTAPVKVSDAVYILPLDNGNPMVTIALYDGATAQYNSVDVVFPKAGVYYISAEDADVGAYTASISSTLLAVPSFKVKPEALPESINVQHDYTQHDATKPDFIKNRPFWPTYNPKIFEMELIFSNGIAMFQNDGTVKLTAPTDGKRYTFAIGENVYSGTAVSGVYETPLGTLPGTAIVAEQDSSVVALYVDVGGMNGWGFVSPAFADSSSANIVVIEGDNAYTELSVPGDVKFEAIVTGISLLNVLDGENINSISAALLNGAEFEIVLVVDGVETVHTNDDCKIDIMGDFGCVVAWPLDSLDPTWFILFIGDDGAKELEVPKGVYFATYNNMFAKSFRVAYPGIFAPTIPAKKIPAECLPGPCKVYIGSTEGDDITRVYKTAERTADVRMSRAELYSMVQSGRAMWHVIEFEGLEMYVSINGIIFENGKDYAEVVYSEGSTSAYTAEYTGS